jgi:hypothetical protein
VSLDTDLWDKVTGYASLSALIGTRLYRSRAEENPTLPYIVCFEVKNRSGQSINGNIVVESPLIQYTILAETDDETIAIRAALRAALVATGYPVVFDDGSSDSDALSGIRRRDVVVRVSRAV